MEISKEKINKFLSLSDRELKSRLTEAAIKNGMASDQLTSMVNNVTNMRKVLAAMSEQDFKKVIAMVGEARLSKMIEDMKL